MKFYIRCNVNFEPKKVIVTAPEDATERELVRRLHKRYPGKPVTKLFVVKTEESPDEFWLS